MTDFFNQMRARAVAIGRRLLPKRWRSDIAVVPVVRLTGVIGFSTPLRPGLTLAGIARTLDRAFGMRNAKAVALLINSPGGSAVQSHLIYQRIRALAAEKNLPVFAAVEDVAASGGYMIACAADEIVCDPASIVGSIGVVGASFGFTEAIRKLGVERRIYTAGENKSMLDPFLPEKEEDVTRLKAIQREIHEMFIDLVRSSRGARLTGPETDLVLGRILDRQDGIGVWCDRSADRSAGVPAGALRRGRDDPGGRGGPRPVRVAQARRQPPRERLCGRAWCRSGCSMAPA